MKRWIALGSFLCLASSGARADSFYCEAQGVYTNCTSQNGYERCQDAVSTGGGIGRTEQEASSEAISSCTTHMTKMVIIGNYPTGSAYSSQRSFVKSSCVATKCSRDTGASSAPAAPENPTDADGFLAQGDARFREGYREQALESWQQALRLAPDRDDLYGRVFYGALVQNQAEAGCQVIDAGLERLPASGLLQLCHAECGIYRRQFQQTLQESTSLIESLENPNLRIGALLLQWISASLLGDGLADCSALANTLGSLDKAPTWDMLPLIVDLATVTAPATPQVIELLGVIGDNGTAAASRLIETCGHSR